MDEEVKDVAQDGSRYADLYHSDLQMLDRHLLRLANLAFSEPKQRKAFVETYRRILWFDWVKNLKGIDGHNMPIGMPIGIDNMPIGMPMDIDN